MSDSPDGWSDPRIAYWLADPSEPPTHPIYAVLFAVFVLTAIVSLYAYRGLPDWIVASRESRFLRLVAGAVALLSVGGTTVIIAQVMRVPFISKRLWLGLIVAGIAIQLGLLTVAAWQGLRDANRPARLPR